MARYREELYGEANSTGRPLLIPGFTEPIEEVYEASDYDSVSMTDEDDSDDSGSYQDEALAPVPLMSDNPCGEVILGDDGAILGLRQNLCWQLSRLFTTASAAAVVRSKKQLERATGREVRLWLEPSGDGAYFTLQYEFVGGNVDATQVQQDRAIRVEKDDDGG